MATGIDITLAGLHQLQERIDRRQLEEQDWAVVGALVSKLIERTEARLARLRDKAAEQAEVAPVNAVGHSARSRRHRGYSRVRARPRARTPGVRARASRRDWRVGP